MSDIPAFPSTNNVVVGNSMTAGHSGMSLRDYFAAKALVGICHFWVQTRTKTTINDPDPDIVAKMSYEFADAMLKARGE